MEIRKSDIFITGASRGIGRAVAKICAQDKVNLHLVVRKNDSDLAEEMLAAGANSCQIWTADLADRKQVEKLIKETSDLKIDVLFNNAGLLCGGLLEEQSMDHVYDMFQVNLTSLVHLTHAFLPRMLKRKRGKIVNHSSIAAQIHFPCASTYVASKAAVLAFTNSLRLELKGTGVSTLCLVTPGVRTGMSAEVEKIYGKHYSMSDIDIPPLQYAEMVREAILLDLEFLEPKGLVGLGLKISKYAPKLFDFGMMKKFSR